MWVRRAAEFPGKFVREVRRRGMGSAIRHTLRALVDQGGGARAEHVAALRGELSALHVELSALPVETAALRAELSALRSDVMAAQADAAHRRGPLAIPAPPDLGPIYAALGAHAESLEWLGRHHVTDSRARADAPAGPLVSAILPVWNRAAMIGEAIASVQAQRHTNWELLVVDDGSTDGTEGAVRLFLADARIRYTWTPHRGQSAARNLALSQARGAFIAYIDSDDVWRPDFLAEMVRALDVPSQPGSAYSAILVTGDAAGVPRIMQTPFDRERLLAGNTVPLTTFVHRRQLYERFGGFDEGLNRLTDWDLILRYCGEAAPMAVPVIGGEYRLGSWPRVSNQESHALASYAIRTRRRPAPDRRLRRVLYAIEFFPHLSETYVETEIAWARRRGIDVHVWSEYDAPVPYATDTPVHRGRLEDAVAAIDPDLIHVHHLYRGLRYAPIAAAAGIGMTVRGHGFEFTPDRLAELAACEAIRRVFQFPHLATTGDAADRIRPMTSCFDPELHFPAGEKDRRLVVRAGLASPTKDIALFIHAAARCPRHHFVLAACWSIGYPQHLDELRALNDTLGAPVDIRPNLSHREVAALQQQAGILLHTHGLVEPYGMPVSIAEAMAAGCYVVARHDPAAATYVGGAGVTYDSLERAVALIRATETWTDARWGVARLAAIDRAFSQFAAADVLAPLAGEWAAIAARAPARR